MKQSKKALNRLVNVIHSELSSGGNVSLIGFDVFFVVDRKVKMARNPKAGEGMEVKIRKILVFKAGSTPKRAVNNR